MGHVIVNASTVTKLRPVVAFEQDQDGTAVPSWSCSTAVYESV